MRNQLTVGFIGLGKLGLPCAETMSEIYDVTGYDIYSKTSDKIKISSTLQAAIKDKDIVFVAVQTPHGEAYDGSTPIANLPNKDFDYSVLRSTLQQINHWASDGQTIVVISTVLPGTIRRELRQLVPKCNLIYNPYFIAMGSVEWDMVNPEMLIIGNQSGLEDEAVAQLIDFYRPLMCNNPKIIIGTWEEAECIKVFYNTFISAKLSLVNMIQDVACRLGNVKVDVITDALATSTMRIMSSKYMTAGMGDAGPCHPRDNIALRHLSESLDLGYDLFETIMIARERQAANLAKYLALLQDDCELPIVIHGKAYKPGIDLVDGSYSLLIGHYLQYEEGAVFHYVDPLTGDSIDNGTAAIVLLAHNTNVTYGYTGQDSEQQQYFEFGSGSIIVDPWRSYTTDDSSIQVIHYGDTRQYHTV